MSLEVASALESYPPEFRPKVQFLRQLIYETAAAIEHVGELEEALKWGEPSYLTSESKAGSTIRVAWKKARPDQYSIFFKCTADLVPAFKEKFPRTFRFGGDRSIDFRLDDEVPVDELKQCIAIALTYHLNKKLAARARWDSVANVIS